MQNAVISQTHPKRYLMHKYWGRKAHNLMAFVIEKYSKPNDLVLDPFMGSGVTLIEGAILGRKTLGFDLNPTSKLIAGVSLSGLEGAALLAAGETILNRLSALDSTLYATQCSECGEREILQNAIWAGSHLARVKTSCSGCGTRIRDVSAKDQSLLDNAARQLNERILESPGWVPGDDIFAFVRRSGVSKIRDLFSPRALLAVAELRDCIFAVPDEKLREGLKLVFSSMLPNVSRMIPGNVERVTGLSGWQISKFWVPKVHTEKPVFSSFRGRLKKVADGLDELNALITNHASEPELGSAMDLHSVATGSVGMIFTDPPYGDSIAYLALSHFWNAWLSPEVNYGDEVIFDTSRGMGLAHFKDSLDAAGREFRRVISPDGNLVATFNNRHMKFWRPFIESIVLNGFELIDVSWVDQAVRSGTQGINRNNTLHGDFLYHFRPSREVQHQVIYSDGDSLLKNHFKTNVRKGAEFTSAQIYCLVIPLLIRNYAFLDGLGKELNIDSTLRSLCDVDQGERGLKWIYRG